MDIWGTSPFFCPYHIGAIFGRMPKKPRSPVSRSLDWLLVPIRLSQPSGKFNSVRSWRATSPLIAFISGHIYCSFRPTRLCVPPALRFPLCTTDGDDKGGGFTPGLREGWDFGETDPQKPMPFIHQLFLGFSCTSLQMVWKRLDQRAGTESPWMLESRTSLD